MNEITDVIIQNSNGLPYFAGCFASEYCRNYADHALLSGFFAAINSFKEELSQGSLKIVGYDDLNLFVETEGQLMVILAAETGLDELDTRDLAKEVLKNFIVIHNNGYDETDYDDPVINDEFSKWLHHRLNKTTNNLLPMLEKKKKGIWARIRAALIE